MSSSAYPPGGEVPEDRDYDEAPRDLADLSIGETLSNVTEDLSTLIRQEIALAKAEARQSVSQAGKGAGMLGGAGVAAHIMLIFASLALTWALGVGLDLGIGWSALIVAVLWGIVAAVLATTGKNKFKDVGLQQTQETAARIPDALKGEETR